MNQKGFAPIVVVAAVSLLAFIGVAGYFVFRQNTISQTEYLSIASPQDNIPQLQSTTETGARKVTESSASLAGENKLQGLKTEKLATIPANFGIINSYEGIRDNNIVFTADGNRFVFGHGNEVVVNNTVYTGVIDSAFSPDGTSFAIALVGGKLIRNGNDEPTFGATSCGSSLILSDNGSHVVYECVKDNKVFVVRDGQASQQYETIDNLKMSADGETWAYVAKKTNQWFVVINGVENKLPQYDQMSLADFFVFSPDGNSIAYRVGTQGVGQKLILNGVEGPAYDSIASDITFSLDSKHIAYRAEKDHKIFVVLDGEEQRHYDNIVEDSIKFSPDGRVGYVAQVGSREFSKSSVVVNGEEGPEYTYISDFTFSPNNRFAYYGYRGTTLGTGKKFFVLDNKEQDSGYSITDSKFTFSAAGEHYAYPGGTPCWNNGKPCSGSEVYMIIDGKKHSNWILLPVWSPDDTRIAHFEFDTDQKFAKYTVWLDDNIIGSYDIIENAGFSRSGKNFAFISKNYSPDRTKFIDNRVVLNGSEGKVYDAVYPLFISQKGEYEPREFQLGFDAEEKYVVYGARIGNELWRIVDEVK